MPARPVRPCSHPGCRALTRDGTGRCEQHSRQQWAKAAKREGTTTQRGYGWAWQQLRIRILKRDNGLCQVALQEGLIEEAAEVDHIINKAQLVRSARHDGWRRRRHEHAGDQRGQAQGQDAGRGASSPAPARQSERRQFQGPRGRVKSLGLPAS